MTQNIQILSWHNGVRLNPRNCNSNSFFVVSLIYDSTAYTMHKKAWINKGPCLSYMNIATTLFFLHSSSNPHCCLSYSFTFAFICHMRMEVAFMTAVACTFSALRWVRLERLSHPPFWSTHVFHVRCLCLCMSDGLSYSFVTGANPLFLVGFWDCSA